MRLVSATQHLQYKSAARAMVVSRPMKVFVDDQKLVGLAQVRRRPGELLQAGIYLRWEPERLVDLLSGTTDERAEMLHLLPGRAVGIHDCLGPSLTIDDIIHAWKQALIVHEGVILRDDTWTDAEQEAISAAGERYAPLREETPATVTSSIP